MANINNPVKKSQKKFNFPVKFCQKVTIIYIETQMKKTENITGAKTMTRLIQKIFLSKRANEIIDAEEAHIASIDRTLAQAKKLLADLNKIGTVKMWHDSEMEMILEGLNEKAGTKLAEDFS